jgi:hypothetical protein
MGEAPIAHEEDRAGTPASPTSGLPPKSTTLLGPFLVTLLAVLCFNVNNFLWLASDGRPLVWDHHSHYTRALKFGYLVRHGHRLNVGTRGFAGTVQDLQADHPAASHLVTAPVRGFVSFTQGLYTGPKHPPAVHATAGTLVALLGPDPDTIVFGVNLLFSAVLLLSVFGIASRYKGPWAGAAAAWFAALFPTHVLEAHVLMLDLPLTASVALAWLALLNTDAFRNRRASIFAGLALGFGWLVKETFPVFVLVPVAAGAWTAWKDIRERGVREALREGPASNLLLTVLVVLLACGFWFLPYVPRMPGILLQHQAMGGLEKDPAWWEAAGALFYASALVNNQLSFLFTGALLAAVPLVGWRLRRHPWTVPLALGFAVPLVLFTFLSNKDMRYTMPVLPVAAVALGAGLTAFRSRALAVAVPLLLLAAGACQCLHHAWGLFGTLPDVPLVRRGEMEFYLHREHPAMRSRPEPAHRCADDLKRLLKAEVDRAVARGKARFEVRHLFDLPEFTAPSEQAWCWPGLDARFTGEGTRVRIRSGFFRPEREINKADLVLLKRGGRRGYVFLEIIDKAVVVFDARRPRFRLVGSVETPDGFRIDAYRPRER